MRISSLQVFNTGLQNMLKASQATTKTQEEISLGKRVINPSDDPTGATQLLKLKEEAAQREQFKKNIDIVDSRLSQEDTLLAGVGNAMQRIRELTLQAGNTAVLTDTDRRSIATELQQQMQHIMGIMNTRDSNNEFVFSGFKGDTQPFTQQGTPTLTNNGTVFYNGDEGQRLVQTSSTTFVASNDAGKNIFVDIPSFSNSFTTSASAINKAIPPATISAGFIYDQALYDAFYPEDIRIVFQDPTAVGPTQANYNVVQKSDGRVLQSNVLYTSGTPIQINGAEFTLAGTPTEGDTFFIDSKNSLDMLTSINQLIDGLATLPVGATLQTLLDKSITNMDSAQTAILQTRSEIGGRLNALDNTKAQHADMALASKQLLSNIEDLDYTEAISRLNFQSFVLQAAQQSFAKVSQLSLFNRL